MKILFQAVLAVALLGAVVAYTYHIWSDCLDDNSIFTCIRMLNK